MVTSEKPTSDSLPWLGDYLADVVARHVCVSVCCTTCANVEFRYGLYVRAAAAVGIPTEQGTDPYTWTDVMTRTDSRTWTDRRLLANPRIQSELITQLALLTPGQSQDWDWDRAIRFIFCEIWDAIGAPSAERMYQPILERTWAGSILSRMQAHHRARMEDIRQQELYNSPEAVHARRAEKRRLRQERHAERLAKKKELDRLWFNAAAMLRTYQNADIAAGNFDPLTMTESSTLAPREGQPAVPTRERAFVPTELILLFRLAGLSVHHLGGGTAGNWGHRPIDLDEIEIMIIASKTAEPSPVNTAR